MCVSLHLILFTLLCSLLGVCCPMACARNAMNVWMCLLCLPLLRRCDAMMLWCAVVLIRDVLRLLCYVCAVNTLSVCRTGMLYMLCITIIAFTDAVCIIKYRMPKENMGYGCHSQHFQCQQQQQQLQQQQTQFQTQVFEVPPPPPNVNQYYASKSDPQFHAVWPPMADHSRDDYGTLV